ncbi:alkaline shock response membrane anchor protein AmaP [Paratractidigestivibacter sp.]|uniref:alkaline shock response membrane anchor protein AmaP n=1 Tax=Paratractidigestivibacter sp. TaxID=2847316 RepID=UPI002ABE426D|nr:alkaline shock response membrane anchor protein AmaP [Paratractidigestivibacter sp.]
MSGFKRLCKVVFALAGIFCLGALALTWLGPWRDVASSLMVVDAYWYAWQVCAAITVLGLLIVLCQGLFARKVRTVEVATVDGGSITVTREAIASQAEHVVEADGTCTASRVHVDAKPRGRVRVHVRVLPHEALDVVVKGAQLHEELLQGLAAVCGNTVENVSLEFVQPQAYAERSAEAADVEETSVAAAGTEDEFTSEITVPMGASKEE